MGVYRIGTDPPDGSVITAESSVTVTLRQKEPKSDAVIYLRPTATVRGHVRDKRGLPVANTSVILVPVREEAGRRTIGAPAGMAMTNAAGEYTLTAEHLGDFLVRVVQTSSGIMSFVYYPDNTDSDKARRITLEREMKLTDIDFQIN
jgi:hypothetical protein